MKKYLKLLIALSLVFVAGVNAKTFDFEGDNIEFGLYSSGDVLRNFDTYSMRVYFKVPNSTLSYIYVFESEDFSTMITGKNVFNVEENVEMPVTVPTVYGRNAIWNYESEEYDDIDRTITLGNGLNKPEHQIREIEFNENYIRNQIQRERL